MAAVLMSRLMYLARRIWRGVRRRLFPRRVYRKVSMRMRAPLRGAEPAPCGVDWPDRLQTIELDDAAAVAGELFKRRFSSPMPCLPRHFVLLYSAAIGTSRREAVAYLHLQRFGEVYLTGGLCVDERAYRSFPRWLYARVREEGGLATIVMKQSFALVRDADAVFGHVGDLRSRQAILRAGCDDTDDEHLMVCWLKALPDEEKRRLVAMVASHGPF
jgi:hypothetical protein